MGWLEESGRNTCSAMISSTVCGPTHNQFMEELYKVLSSHRSWDDVICDKSIKGGDRKNGITFSMDKRLLLDVSLP